MAYNPTRPADTDLVKKSAELIRENLEGLRKDGIVFAKPPLYGAGGPKALAGENGDRYIDTATGNEYHKSPSGWVQISDMGKIYKTSAGVYYTSSLPDNTIGIVGDACFGEGNLAQKIYIKESSGWAQKCLIPKGSEKYQNLGSVSGTKNLNAANGTVIKLTVTGSLSITLTATFENGYGGTLTLLMRNGGAHTVTWPASISWAGMILPTLSRSSTDLITLTTIDGRDWVGTIAGATPEEEEKVPNDAFVFTESGSITAPTWAKYALISGCGAGAGGGGGTRSGYGGGGGGGAGATVMDKAITVVPGQTYAITIGKGGARGYHTGSGENGGSTSFGSLLTLGGGTGGKGGGSGGSAAGSTGTGGAEMLTTAARSAYIADSQNRQTGGRGGSTPWGNGGIWVSATTTPTGQDGQGIGAGGSGGYSGNDFCYGSAGMSGFLTIKWVA